MRVPQRLLTFSASVLALALLAGIGPAKAGIGDDKVLKDKGAETQSLLGSYLAGRVARGANDTEAAAAYYSRALERDPGNEVLTEFAFLMEATEGHWERTEALAQELVRLQPNNRTAHMFLALASFKAGRLGVAEDHFRRSSANPIGELTALLSRAWVMQAQGKTSEALAMLDVPRQPDWAQYYLRYHRALIADQAGRRGEARTSYERIPKADQRTLRVTLAYARHAANGGDMKTALGVLRAHFDRSRSEGHPVARSLEAQVEAGRKPSPLVTTPSQGLAEVFYGLGEALSGETGNAIGSIYLQFALYLEPDFPFALATLANAYEASRRYTDAIEAYDRIPRDTPLQASVDIRKALNLNLLGRVDEAQKLLEEVADRNPKDIRPLDALGSIMRSHKRYADTIIYYTKAIALIDRPEQKHWSYYYSRGTSYERVKDWPSAEADLRLALKLNPDESMVLNYLGYSWIDQGRNLKQGLALIQKALQQKPDDGYIVDSLGWAYFRLGRFKDAVKHLERAVELRPEDPVLNDHLGDGYWRIGREREARFQWEQALTLSPEPEDEIKIRQKLENGLPNLTQARQVKKIKETVKSNRAKKSTEAKPAVFPFFQ